MYKSLLQFRSRSSYLYKVFSSKTKNAFYHSDLTTVRHIKFVVLNAGIFWTFKSPLTGCLVLSRGGSSFDLRSSSWSSFNKDCIEGSRSIRDSIILSRNRNGIFVQVNLLSFWQLSFHIYSASYHRYINIFIVNSNAAYCVF